MAYSSRQLYPVYTPDGISLSSVSSLPSRFFDAPGKELSQEHPVRHILDDRLIRRTVLETNTIPHLKGSNEVQCELRCSGADNGLNVTQRKR